MLSKAINLISALAGHRTNFLQCMQQVATRVYTYIPVTQTGWVDFLHASHDLSAHTLASFYVIYVIIYPTLGGGLNLCFAAEL